MKKLLMFCLILLTNQGEMWGQDKSLFLKMTDGTIHEFVLKSEPLLTISNNQIIVENSGNSALYNLSDVIEYTFDISSGIDAIFVDAMVEIQGDAVVFNGNYSEQDIFVTDTVGKAVSADIIINENNVVVSLAPLPNGIYLIKAKNVTIKISKQ